MKTCTLWAAYEVARDSALWHHESAERYKWLKGSYAAEYNYHRDRADKYKYQAKRLRMRLEERFSALDDMAKVLQQLEDERAFSARVVNDMNYVKGKFLQAIGEAQQLRRERADAASASKNVIP